MGFDVISMKQRAKMLMKTVKPSPLFAGVLIVVLNIVWLTILGDVSETAAVLALMLLYGVINALLMTSLKWFCLKVTRGEDTVFSDILIGFKEKQVQVVIVSILKAIVIYIGMFFLFVGAVFPIYWFRFAECIIKDDDSINPFRAMGQSMKLMKGHYSELIKLDLTMIGWWALYIVTFGLAGVYVLPYTSMVYTEFYDYIKGQYEAFNQ